MPTLARTLPVAVRTRAAAVDRASLRLLLCRCLESEAPTRGSGLGVILASDRLVRELNRDWRGKDTTTDVLSFPAGDPPPLPSGAEESAVRHLGEIVVSVPRCRAQAQEQGVDPGVELVRLVIHGLLHLLGHDHEKPAERARMQARERVLRRWASSRGLGPGMLRDPRVPVRAGRRPLRREAARRTR